MYLSWVSGREGEESGDRRQQLPSVAADSRVPQQDVDVAGHAARHEGRLQTSAHLTGTVFFSLSSLSLASFPNVVWSMFRISRLHTASFCASSLDNPFYLSGKKFCLGFYGRMFSLTPTIVILVYLNTVRKQVVFSVSFCLYYILYGDSALAETGQLEGSAYCPGRIRRSNRRRAH